MGFSTAPGNIQKSEWIWVNGELVRWDECRVHALTHGLHYASGVFEGIRAYETADGPAVFRLHEHMRRLIDSARVYRMDVPYSVEQLEQATLEMIGANRLSACYVRPLVFRGYGSLGVNPLTCPVETVIAAFPWGTYLGKDALENGVDVKVSSWSRARSNTFPTVAKATANYANGALIKMEAVAEGFSEGIALDTDGYVSEGSGENIFLVRDGRILTPGLDCAILPGITRDTVITLARRRGIEVVETRIPRSALYIMDEIFFTGTAAEVTPIRSVDRVPIGAGKRGPITEQLQADYLALVRGEVPDEDGWRTLVPARAESSAS
jgi:branched-chain amino acid aminotransferase